MGHILRGAAAALAIAPLLGAAAADPGDRVLIHGGTFVMGTDGARIAALKERYGVGWPGVFENETPARGITVWEFLYDAWEPNYPTGDAIDPVAGGWLDDDSENLLEGRRAVRGASFGGAVVNLRTRWRDSHLVGNAVGFVGFRCAYPAAPAAGSDR